MTSEFGAEFCAMKHVIENLHGVGYKLPMMGVPVTGALYVYVSMSIITNTSNPELTLTKKLNEICYHVVHEAMQWEKPLLPTSQPRITWLTYS